MEGSTLMNWYWNMKYAKWKVHNLGCLLSKGNQANHPKFERPNGKKHKIQIFFEIGPDLVCPAHLKAQLSEFFEDLNRIKTNKKKEKSMTFLIVLHLKPKKLI